MWASWRGDRAATATLLEAGADPNARDRFGFTPLWIYSYNSSAAIGLPTILLRPITTASRPESDP
jgi:ankyrin repeat protein